jgi:hypothetical protein
MNRLVLIGNGFDQAHDLKTSYGHFIDDFWFHEYFKISKRKGSSFDDKYIEITFVPINI